MWLDMGRVQGTSDLLPADITGSLIYNPKTSEFDTMFGPIMHECVLVDEINRMPSKTQSALLQAMAEWHIVIGQETYDLPQHFTIFATQNPHDRIGTFPLPQAQLDRFMCQVTVAPVNLEQQGKILNQTGSQITNHKSQITNDDIEQIAQQYQDIIVPGSITSSVAQLLQDQWLSSRAWQHIIAFARALALMSSKGQVDQSDIVTALNYTIEHRLK
jgi:MoxR-like ATPase